MEERAVTGWRHWLALNASTGALLGAILLVPWALFVVFGSKDIAIGSIRGLEAFPDTNNPGYFLIKTALWILAGLMLAQAAIDIAQPRRNH